jgi:hypothetical protein
LRFEHDGSSENRPFGPELTVHTSWLLTT